MKYHKIKNNIKLTPGVYPGRLRGLQLPPSLAVLWNIFYIIKYKP